MTENREEGNVMDQHGPEPALMIRGELVGLGPLRRDLASTFQRWMNDLGVVRTLAQPRRPMTVDAEHAWLDGALTSSDAIFTIYELDTLRPIGNTGLENIHATNGTCEFGIVIGERDAWGKGHGTEATRLMLSYAFDVLGLHSVRLAVYANNERAIRAYERAGFRRAGRIRGAQRIGRARIDEIMMDAVVDDFEPSFLHEIMHP
ncbi:MAG TPA: GNAT family protein [Thermomicrobiales bacterium]|nr:GNAT family protein [Thermomicrobiales bacterium]